MSITVQDLLTTLGNRAWSGFNKDDMVFGNEEAQTALAELNAANRYLMSLRDFPFKKVVEEIVTSRGIAEYPMIEGQILEIINTDNFQQLKIINNPQKLKQKSGEPTGFYVDYYNPDANIILYPTPDKTYNYKVTYNTYKFILDKYGNTINEFQNADDYINLPYYLEYLYADCLILRTMATNNKDEQDENYAPILKEFAEAWRNFIKAAKPVKQNNRVVW